MHIKNSVSGLMLMPVLLLCLCTAWAQEPLTPFEDPTTNLWGYRNAGGTVIIKPRFSVAGDFSSHGIAAVADDSGWQYIDRNGTIIIRPFLFDNGPDPFQEGLARFQKEGKFGFFDERAQVVIPPQFDFAAPFFDGYASFCKGCKAKREGEHGAIKGGLWGFIDRKGKIVITPRFENAYSFEQGKARVMLNGKWVFIDKQGNPVQ